MTDQFHSAVGASGRRLLDLLCRLGGLRSIAPVRPDSIWLERIEALWQEQRGDLGPVPVRTLVEHADAGTLLAATEGSTLLGFVSYNVNGRGRVAITHLVVNPSARSAGVAKLLMYRALQPRAEISALNEGRYGLHAARSAHLLTPR